MRRPVAISLGVHLAVAIGLVAATLAETPVVQAPPVPTVTASLARLPAPPKPIPPKPEPVAAPPPVPQPAPKPVAAPKRVTRPTIAPAALPIPIAAPAPAAEPEAAIVPSAPTEPAVATLSPDRSWLAAVHARLAAAKRYPATALRRREQGTALIEIRVERGGQVLARKLVRSSGSSALDREALDLAERASPLPPMPPSMPQGSMVLVVPVSFSLN
jgi:protein TonB